MTPPKNPAGYRGKLLKYVECYPKSWKIRVECDPNWIEGGSYVMLESEFEEYDIPQKKFKAGDVLTYKSVKDLHEGKYFHGGKDYGGETGELLYYNNFNETRGVWNMQVSYPKADGSKSTNSYNMLESEFEEFDSEKEISKKDQCGEPGQRFTIGQTLTYKSRKSLPNKSYNADMGGDDLGGYKGNLLRYDTFNLSRRSWNIEVSCDPKRFSRGYYCMFESEFEEYDYKTKVAPKKRFTPKKRFKVGDQITYKSVKDLPMKNYENGGECQGGCVGKIISYRNYVREFNCYEINVSSSDKCCGVYEMLESEFVEYDTPKKIVKTVKETESETDLHKILIVDVHEVPVSDIEYSLTSKIKTRRIPVRTY